MIYWLWIQQYYFYFGTCNTSMWDSVECCSRSCVSSGVQCGLPESGSEGRAGRGSEAAGVQPNWQHHLLSFPVHHQRPVRVWQAHVHRSAHLPGSHGSRFHLLRGLFWEQSRRWISRSRDWRLCLDLIKWNGNLPRAANTTFWSPSRLLCPQILTMNKDINPTELDFLLRYPVQPGVTSPVDFLSNHSWGGIKVQREAGMAVSLPLLKCYEQWRGTEFFFGKCKVDSTGQISS